MEIIYPIFIAFILVFLSELGDKTQLLVLSFSTKLKTVTILLGVALGSLFSHGIAIIFGSTLSGLGNETFQESLKFITYISFILFGIITLLPEKEKENSKAGLVKKISSLGFNYILIIALSIAVGELGDKTFLSSIGLGIGYPNSKIYLIIGAILGMVVSDTLAIVLGKILSQKISDKFIKLLSGLLFIIFGVVGLLM
ncbi:MAG: TMEM165/GDT1 family protein [Clostridia bacterium]|nr:TMEM165/GDT1 family protein [Clostridia bacterium]